MPNAQAVCDTSEQIDAINSLVYVIVVPFSVYIFLSIVVAFRTLQRVSDL